MSLHDEKTLKDFDKWGKARPTHEAHGEAIQDVNEDPRMQKQLPTHWRLEGNLLKGKTSMGEFAHTIPPDYILTGTDAAGKPIFEKIKM